MYYKLLYQNATRDPYFNLKLLNRQHMRNMCNSVISSCHSLHHLTCDVFMTQSRFAIELFYINTCT
jgi:hypothetical protein